MRKLMTPTKKRREQGIAMIMALTLLVVVGGVVTLMFARTLGEIQHSADDAGIVQTLMIARGSANLGASVLTTDVRAALGTLVASNSNLSGSWSFGTNNNAGTAPTPASVISQLEPVTTALQASIDNLVCSNTFTTGGSAVGRVRIYVTDEACGEPLLADVRMPAARFVGGQPRTGSGYRPEQEYAIPFVMVATGEIGDFNRNVVLQGEYRFTVGRGSFARYALFTNVHRSGPSGSDIWFTDRTLFDGPVHTNSYFRYYRQSWFGDEVTSAGCSDARLTKCNNDYFGRQGAEFYNAGFKGSGSMSPSSQNPSYTNGYGTHAPELTGGVDWSADFVPLPENSQNQISAAQGDTSDPNVRGEGLYFGNSLYSLDLWAGGPTGTAMELSGGQWRYWDGGAWRASPAPFQYIKACTTSTNCGLYRYGADKVLYSFDPIGNMWVVAASEFNGVIYGAGTSTYSIDRIRGPQRMSGHDNDPAYAPPAIASFAEITIASTNSMRISGDLKYEDRPCSGEPTRQSDGTVLGAVCDNLEAVNVLGLYTQTGNIMFGHNNGWNDSRNAPRDVTVDAVLMSGEGRVSVEDYDSGSERGSVHLTGGIIEYYYGAFGTFNASTGKNSTGYGRSFTYDRRMAAGVAPPYFPTVGTDGVKSVKLFSFGQREQLQ